MKFDQERSRENIRICRPYNRNIANEECKSESDTGATGTISGSFIKHLNNAQGEHKIKELQKIAILGTAHILRKVLM